MSTMDSIISSLIDPKPKIGAIDPEDGPEETEIWTEGHSGTEIETRASGLKRRRRTDLSETNQRYSGVKVNRKQVEEEDEEEDNEEDSEEEEEVEEYLEEATEAPIAQTEDLTSSSAESVVNQFSDVSLVDHVTRGSALKRQIAVFDDLLETRIKAQKHVLSSNRLPQHTRHALLNRSEIEIPARETSESLKRLIDCLLAIDNRQSKATESGEHVTIEELSAFLNERHVTSRDARDSTLDTWFERTRFTKRSFEPILESISCSFQIKKILLDEKRLLKRTQTKRSSFTTVLKTPEEEETDPEIFDDQDFYHNLLRELVDRKSADQNQRSAKWREIQRLRSKMRRKVDTKASKGRRLRYDVIPKIVSFMAPIERRGFEEEARNQLFESLFGRK